MTPSATLAEPTDLAGSLCEIVTICNSRGLHARAAAKFVKAAMSFSCETIVMKGDISVSGRSIMGLMMLSASKGSVLKICTHSGDDAALAISAMADLVRRGFDEN